MLNTAIIQRRNTLVLFNFSAFRSIIRQKQHTNLCRLTRLPVCRTSKQRGDIVSAVAEGDTRDGRFYFTTHDGRSTHAARAMIDNEPTLTSDLQTPSHDDRCASTSKQHLARQIRSAWVTYTPMRRPTALILCYIRRRHYVVTGALTINVWQTHRAGACIIWICNTRRLSRREKKS